MNVAELREKSVEELKAQLNELAQERFALRMSLASGQLEKTHLVKENRRAIAQIKTLLNEKGE
ncbi:MAG: 50S ribosomal protein L29 [Pseudomonadota bacterium]|nr:50S ribosomal protein L29 [Pseudomonadota bacterium]